MPRLLRRQPEAVAGRARPPWPLRVLQAAFIAALWAAIGAAVVLAAITALSALFGLRAFTVLTGSMKPTLEPGTVVINEPLRPREARPGDIVTFPDPGRANRLTTHRLQSMALKGGKAFMVTKGDANDKPERWNVPLEGELGRGIYQVPKVGYARAWIGDKVGQIGVLAILALWGLLAIAEIWRPSAPKDRSAASEEDDDPSLTPIGAQGSSS